MNISAGDLLLEVVGPVDEGALEAALGCRAVQVWPYARLGDFTLQVSSCGGSAAQVYERLRAGGWQVLGHRQRGS